MRSIFLLAALLVAVAVAAIFVARNRSGPDSASARGTVTLVGDSLNVGVERYLPAALPGWKVVANDRVGRSTLEGVAELEAGRPALSSYVVVSLGTNDPRGAADAFRRNVERVLELGGPNRCIVWATIWRDGAPADDFNAVLRDAAGSNRRLRLVEWADMARQHPDLLAADGLHGNEVGYRKRAEAVAAAVKDCSPEQTVTEQ
jgi:lysophospholipase L1-like esterase